jgi:hypothetical protein
MKEWIPVRRDLPEKNTYVLIYTPYCRYKACVGYYNGVQWIGTDGDVIMNVSLWMPLPKMINY